MIVGLRNTIKQNLGSQNVIILNFKQCKFIEIISTIDNLKVSILESCI